MCGIAGVLNLADQAPPEAALLRRMAGALKHRGPDEFGIYRDRRAGLAHTRLSIIDLASGQQPLANEDGSRWIVFNGEVYNYVELRPELERAGHRFRTASDTEVLLHAYEEWGEAAVERFNGQFAFAIWDRARRELFLARDRLGVRPIYLAEHAGRLWFASEVKAIFAEPSFPRALDPVGIDQVFTFWTTVAPRTPFRGVGELEPGTWLRVAVGGGPARTVRRRYWTPRYLADAAALHTDPDAAAEELRERLRAACKLRMLRADVPVGAYLSGGIDSSITAAMGREFAHGRFRTFSIRFADAEFDETPYQRLMVERLGSEHQEMVVRREDIARVFPEVILHTERPVLRTAPAPLFLLSGLVRRHGFKVVLTGEGADEMLAGYDLFREAKVRAFWGRQPGSESRPRLLEKLYPYLARSPVAARAMARKFFAQGIEDPNAPGFSHMPRWNAAAALKRLFSAAQLDATRGTDAVGELIGSLPGDFSTWPPLCRAQYLEVKTLLSGYLLSSQGDRMLMAHSVEGRFPFLDPDVVEFADALPPSYKLRVLDEKHLLKRASKGVLPEEILTRPKQPYRAPDAASFTGSDVPDYVEDALGARSVAAAGIFDAAAVSALHAKCRSRRGEVLSNADNMAFVGVLSTQILWQRFVASAPGSEELPAETIRTDVELAGD